MGVDPRRTDQTGVDEGGPGDRIVDLLDDLLAKEPGAKLDADRVVPESPADDILDDDERPADYVVDDDERPG